ncbi:MAG: SDR family oxidoreductase, partial [Clostridiales bacterium]|nr:SDR family oxidoreductase [Clostridiales bacterium]
TGGSGAIGRAICFNLAASGAVVYVSGRTENSILSVVNEIREAGLKAEPLIMDVSDADSVEKAFSQCFEDKPLHILVNCAGGGSRTQMLPLSEQSVEVIDSVLNTNLRGAMLCTRKAAQHMIAGKRGGRIIIISSAVASGGKAKYSEYAAAKSGDIGFMKSMALELGQYGITVNCVSPGFIQRGEYNEDTVKYLKSTNCLHSVGTLEDVANAVLFIASDEAGFITGQNLGVDGGRTLGLYGD